MLKQSLNQKMLQKLSPQQIQLMKLLQIPTATLDQRIKEELEANPALDEGEEVDETVEFGSTKEEASKDEKDAANETENEETEIREEECSLSKVPPECPPCTYLPHPTSTRICPEFIIFSMWHL